MGPVAASRFFRRVDEAIWDRSCLGAGGFVKGGLCRREQGAMTEGLKNAPAVRLHVIAGGRMLPPVFLEA